MTFLAFDCETECFAPGYKAPRPACFTWDSPTQKGKIVHANNAHHTIEAWLTGKEILVGQNTAYDTVVICEWYPDLMPLVFKAYDEDRITCTKIREQLIDTAYGRFRGSLIKGEWVQRGYSLRDMASRYLGKTLDKDTWRLRYGELVDLAIIQWPLGALEYAIGDAIDTRTLAEIQEQQKHLLVDQFRQARAQFAFALTSARGLRADPERVEEFAIIAEGRFSELRERLQASGLVRADRVNKKGEVVEGTANVAAAREAMLKACEDASIEPAMTKGGKGVEDGGKGPQVALGADACDRVKGDPVIDDYSEFLTARKVLSNDVKMLRGATRICHPQYDMTVTGRSTCSGPNIQALRKQRGIRDCFVPDPGYVFIQCDYPGLELFTNAQSCYTRFGFSALGETLKADKDAHLLLAAAILKRPYEELEPLKKSDPVVKEARQASKPINFGLPGGLGSKRTVALAAKDYKVMMTEDEAKERKKIWLRTYPEMQKHLDSARDLAQARRDGERVRGDQVAGLSGETCPFSGQVTSHKTYSEIANERFQRLGAIIGKEALYQVCKACFLDESSALYGAYPVAFIHDEIICETPRATFRAAAKELARIMCEAANKYLIDVPMKLTGPMKVESQAMAIWSKDAEPIYNAAGELLICEKPTYDEKDKCTWLTAEKQ